MIRNEEYIKYLKSVISCVNCGDYYSIKELSTLYLNKLQNETLSMKKNLHKYLNSIDLKNLKKFELSYILNLYAKYLFNEFENSKKFSEIASIDDFIKEFK